MDSDSLEVKYKKCIGMILRNNLEERERHTHTHTHTHTHRERERESLVHMFTEFFGLCPHLPIGAQRL